MSPGLREHRRDATSPPVTGDYRGRRHWAHTENGDNGTAELREDQKDSDSIPPYEILDVILDDIFKNGIGSDLDNLIEKGFNPKSIKKVRTLYLNSEYKRRQLVQTIKVSESAFGIGRRYPVLKHLRFENIN